MLVLVLGCTGSQDEPAGTSLRVISLAPSITETLFAIGAGDAVVGVTRYCNYPEKARTLPRIGDFATVDLESIVRLKPDLVIATTDGNPRETVEKLESLGITTLIVGTRGFEDIISSMAAIGEAVGRGAAAREIAARIRSEWNATAARHEGQKDLPVLLLVGINPLVAAGEGSFGDELIRQAGGRNVFSDSGKAYVTTNHEAIISLEPAVILQSAMGSETDEQVRKDWSRWSSIPAVRDARVYVLDQDLINRPGPRIMEALRLVEKTIHAAKKAD